MFSSPFRVCVYSSMCHTSFENAYKMGVSKRGLVIGFQHQHGEGMQMARV